MAGLGDFSNVIGGWELGIDPNLLMTAGYVLFIILVFGVCGILIWSMMKYKYIVQVIDKRGKDAIRTIDAGKIFITRDGIKKFKLRKNKAEIVLPDQKYIHAARGLFKKGFVTYYKFGEDSYTPVRDELDTNETDTYLKPIEQDVSDVRGLMLDMDDKYSIKGWFEKYGVIAVVLGGFTLIAVTQLFMIFMIQDTMSGMGGVASSFEKAAEMLSQCTVAPAP